MTCQQKSPFTSIAAWLLCVLLSAPTLAADGPVSAPAAAIPVEARPVAPGSAPLLQLGKGDQVTVGVFGRPEMTTTTYVSDDGTIRIPLAGAVAVVGVSPAEAAKRIEAALKLGEYLVDPHVTLTVTQSLSQRVSVLGEVNNPGRYPIENNSTVIDVIAQAGGVTALGSDVIYVLRADKDGLVQRLPVNIRQAFGSDDGTLGVLQTLKGGDSIVVPKAEMVYITGEVRNPGEFRVEGEMTLLTAISRAGGVNDRGSTSRIEIRRRGKDDKYITLSGKLGDKVQPGDVIKVKERIF